MVSEIPVYICDLCRMPFFDRTEAESHVNSLGKRAKTIFVSYRGKNYILNTTGVRFLVRITEQYIRRWDHGNEYKADLLERHPLFEKGKKLTLQEENLLR
ncbi:MAG: hypothetical protein IH934_05035 [Nanoarchaeota archaeon]|nr:hypothetical protein [Nanoarchaeota archaeon]